jgi:predicted HD superfamily hydrolase involved in NAD metabolism
VVLEEEDRRFPQLWHAFLAAEMVKTTFGVLDETIQRAVRIHPTGDEGMGLLDKILFLADCIEPGRCFDSVSHLRSLAYQDLDQAVIEALRNKIEYIRTCGRPLHSRSLRALADLETRRNPNKQILF